MKAFGIFCRAHHDVGGAFQSHGLVTRKRGGVTTTIGRASRYFNGSDTFCFQADCVDLCEAADEIRVTFEFITDHGFTTDYAMANGVGYSHLIALRLA